MHARRQGGDPRKRRSYFPPEKQFLVTRNDCSHLMPTPLFCKLVYNPSICGNADATEYMHAFDCTRSAFASECTFAVEFAIGKERKGLHSCACLRGQLS
eukprot:1157848-Pelagomonas_calceolata.AAC.3